MSNALGQCDMVLAISEKTINDQIGSLVKDEDIKIEWNFIVIYDLVKKKISEVRMDQSTAKFNQDIDNMVEQDKKNGSRHYAFKIKLKKPPTIKIIKNRPFEIILDLSFEKGTMYYTVHNGVIKVDMTNWKYAVYVNIGQKEKRATDMNWLTAVSKQQFAKIASDSGIPQNQFLIENVFLDFGNSDFSSYDKAHSKVPLDETKLKVFQYLVGTYFKTLAESKNPYTLGHVIKIKKEVTEETALFAPTAVRFSTSYDKDRLQENTLNFLMMTGDKPFPSGQNVGILPAPLIPRLRSGGMFAIDADLFIKNIYQQLEVEKNFEESVKGIANNTKIKLNRNDDEFKSEVASPIIGEAAFTSNQYHFSAMDTPYWVTLRANSAATINFRRDYEVSSIICPTLSFFDSDLSLPTTNKKFEVEMWEDTSNGRKKKIGVSVDFPSFSTNFDQSVLSALPSSINLGIVIYANIEIDMSANLDGDLKKEHGYLRTEVPRYLLCSFKAGGYGGISNTTKSGKISTRKHKIDDGGSNVNNSIAELETVSLKSVDAFITNLSSAITNLCSPKVILPMGKVYTFKNLQFNQPIKSTKSEDNYVRLEVKYAPSI